jgi:hypothetical protein
MTYFNMLQLGVGNSRRRTQAAQDAARIIRAAVLDEPAWALRQEKEADELEDSGDGREPQHVPASKDRPG